MSTQGNMDAPYHTQLDDDAHSCLQGARPLAKTIPGGSGNSPFMSAAGSDTSSQDPYSYDMRAAYKAGDGTSWGEHSDWNDTANAPASSVGHGADGHEASAPKASRRWTGHLHFLTPTVQRVLHSSSQSSCKILHVACIVPLASWLQICFVEQACIPRLQTS
jgi:hypothetical protein